VNFKANKIIQEVQGGVSDSILVKNAAKKLESILRHKSEQFQKAHFSESLSTEEIQRMEEEKRQRQVVSDEKERLANKEVFLEYKKVAVLAELEALSSQKKQLRAQSQSMEKEIRLLVPSIVQK